MNFFTILQGPQGVPGAAGLRGVKGDQVMINIYKVKGKKQNVCITDAVCMYDYFASNFSVLMCSSICRGTWRKALSDF